LEASFPALMMVRGMEEANYLMKQIRSRFPTLSQRIAVYHQEQALEQRLAVEKMVQSQILSAVIAPWSAEKLIKFTIPHIIIFHLPPDPVSLLQSTSTAEKVSCFWSGEELEKDRSKLMSLYPERSLIGSVYQQMIASGAGNGAISIGRLEKSLHPGERNSLHTCLAIMEELGLVTINRQDGDTTIGLLPAGEKKDLHASWRYREGERTRQAWDGMFKWATARTILPHLDILYGET